MIRVKRVHEPHAPSDGARFLVDRVWPRGFSKQQVKVMGWLKEVAPSTQLRKWFGHDPARWKQFQKRYYAELDDKPKDWEPLRQAAEKGDVTLVFSARDAEHNNAVALKSYLEKRPKKAASKKRTKTHRATPAFVSKL